MTRIGHLWPGLVLFFIHTHSAMPSMAATSTGGLPLTV